MNRITIFIPLLLLFFACSDVPEEVEEQEPEELQDNFNISGNIEDGQNQTVYLEALSPQGKINVAEARTNSEGDFEMVGNIPGFGLYQLRLGEGEQNIMIVTLVPGDELKVNTSVEEFSMHPQLSGTRWASTMTKYMDLYSDFVIGQGELSTMRDSLPEAELNERYMALREPIDSFAVRRLKDDPGNPFNIVLSEFIKPRFVNQSFEFKDWNPQHLDVLKAVAAAYEVDYPGSPVSSTMSNMVYNIEVQFQEHQANFNGTRTAPEIALPGPDGQEIKLSDLRGNYVLIDFWASWCRPCRMENPNVVKLYNKYKNKGFTIYSVSLDDNAAAWQQAIEQDGLVWPNHVSDLKGWESPLPQLYGFNGIPHTVLVNPEGKIIGVKLRGADLEQKLKEIFSN